MNIFELSGRDADGWEYHITAKQERDGTGAGDIVDAIYEAIDAAMKESENG